MTQQPQLKRFDNFVAALPRESEHAKSGVIMPAGYDVSHRIDAPLSATQHIEMQTSAVDRSKGFLIASVPLYAAFALGVLFLSILFAGVPFWSFWSLSIFWLSFVLAWVWGYRETLNKSAEGIAHYEARMKWTVIMREQDKRWEYYDNLMEAQNGRTDE